MSDRLTLELEKRPCRCDIAKLHVREMTTAKLVVSCKDCLSEHEISFPKYLTDVAELGSIPETGFQELRPTVDVRFRTQHQPEPEPRDVPSRIATFTPYDVDILRRARILIDEDVLAEMRVAAGLPNWEPQSPRE